MHCSKEKQAKFIAKNIKEKRKRRRERILF
jgi:hypothetical protein